MLGSDYLRSSRVKPAGIARQYDAERALYWLAVWDGRALEREQSGSKGPWYKDRAELMHLHRLTFIAEAAFEASQTERAENLAHEVLQMPSVASEAGLE